MPNNYDHLLTRIYDKQEKKMFYVGDRMPDNCYSDFLSKYHDNFTLLAINEYGLCVGAYTKDIRPQIQILNVSFGDRFIPMLCSAYKDCNKKLIYEHDVIKTPNIEYVIERYQGMFIAEHTDDYYSLYDVITQLTNAKIPIEISGNIHENSNPLTKKEANHDK